MKKSLKDGISVIAICLVLIVQLATPFHAYADDEVTSQPTDVPEETSTPDPTETPVTIPETRMPEEISTPVPTEPALDPIEADLSATPATDPTATITATQAAIDTPSESTEPAAVEEVAEEQVVEEILDAIPEGTDLVVLNEDGEPEPLATQEATEIIVTGDPVWCPEGASPGDATCTSSYTSLADLLNYLGSLNGGTGVDSNGTIWIESTYDSSVNDPSSSGFTLDGSIFTTWADYSLTLQGGWGGTTNSIFNVPITILDWNNVVTVNNITIENSSGGGLYVSTVGSNADVNINNVVVSGASGFGLGVDTYGGANTNIKDSRFEYSLYDSSNQYYPWGDGVDVYAYGGDVNVVNSQLYGNEWDGLFVVGANNVVVRDSYVAYNQIGGVDVVYSNNIVLDNGWIYENNYYGVSAYCVGNLFISNSAIFGHEYDVQWWYIDGNDCTIDPNNIPDGSTADDYTGSGNAGGYITLASSSQVTFNITCDTQPSFTINLPNGDKVEIVCPVSGVATISRLDNTTLPAPLPAGYTFASAFQVDILRPKFPLEYDETIRDYKRETIDVITEGGYIKTSFFVNTPTPQGQVFSILYWEESETTWIPLKGYLSGNFFHLLPGSDEDEQANKYKKIILSGVQRNPLDGRIEVLTNFPGIFVLAQR